MGDCRFSPCRTTKILPHFPHPHDAARRFDWSAFLRALGNRPDKSPQYKPRRSRTQRAFLKPRSTAPSSVHFTPDRLRSASISETTAQCERYPRKMTVEINRRRRRDSGRSVDVPDHCFDEQGWGFVLGWRSLASDFRLLYGMCR